MTQSQARKRRVGKFCAPPQNPPETWAVRLGENPFILRLKKLNGEQNPSVLFLNVQAIVSMEMNLSQKSFFLCLAAIKRLSKPLPFITTSHGVSGVNDLLHVCPEGLGAGRQLLVF